MLTYYFQLYCWQGNQLTTIPANRLPPGLMEIDFEQNPIRTIDEDAFRGLADTMTDLSFSQALFTDLPKALLQLNNLNHLTISDMQIFTWDVGILKHIGLTLDSLLLTNVSLTSWPSWITFLPHLGTLELSNMVFQVPDNGLDNQVNTLSSVNFENLNLTEIPSAISKLIHLQYLVLDNNKISKISGLPNASSFTLLSLDGNRISDAGQLSEGLRAVSSYLTTLQLRENRLQSLPDLSAMSKLDALYLNENVISSVGGGKVPPSLRFIELVDNYIPSLYVFMQAGIHLVTVRFDHNYILEIRDVDIPVSVTEMSIMYNRITELSDASFPVNSKMGSLSLDFNPISTISLSAFTNLKNLFYLSLGGTQLTRLPLALGALTKLITVSLAGNDHLVCTCMEKSLRDWSLAMDVDGDCGLTSIIYFFKFMSDQCPD